MEIGQGCIHNASLPALSLENSSHPLSNLKRRRNKKRSKNRLCLCLILEGYDLFYTILLCSYILLFFFVKQQKKYIITCFRSQSCWLDSDSCGLLHRWRNICNYQRRWNDLPSCWVDSDSCNYQGRSGRHFSRRRETRDACICSLHCAPCCSRNSCCCTCGWNNGCCTGPGSTLCMLCCQNVSWYWRWRQPFIKITTILVI